MDNSPATQSPQVNPVSALPPQPPVTPLSTPNPPSEVVASPPLETPPTIVTNDLPKPSKSPFKLVLLLLFILLIVGLGIGGWYGYQNIYLSPERVVAEAASKITQMNSYEYVANASLKTTIESQPTYSLLPSSVSAKFTGSSDLSTQSHSLSIEASSGGKSYGQLDIRAFKDSVFLQVSNVPEEIIGSYNSLQNIWFMLTLDEIKEKYLGDNYSPDDLGISSEVKETLSNNLSQNQVFRVTQKLSPENINGQATFHYKYEVDKEAFKKLMADIEKATTGQESTEAADKIRNEYYDNFEFVPGEIWIGKKDRFIYKLTFGAIYRADSTNMALDTTLEMKSINSPVMVDKPSDSKTMDQLMELLGINSAAQLAQARDTQRRSDLFAITNSTYQFAAEHNGNLPDTDGVATRSTFPTKETCIGTSPECFNLGAANSVKGEAAVVPTYIASIPMDPSIGTQENTGYTIYVDVNGRIVATAKGEASPEIKITR